VIFLILLIWNTSLFLYIIQPLINKHKVANMATPITVAYGNGIGPEIMAATLKILTAAGAD
jgi:hypothetical protein